MRDARALVLIAVTALAACAEEPAPESTNGEGAQQATPITPPADTVRPASHDSGVVAGTIGDLDKSYQALATLTEDSVKLSHAVLPGGQTTIAFHNNGKQAHALEIRAAHGGTWRSLPIKAGGTTLMTMSLIAGVYDVYCPLKHGSQTHRDAGVRTQFIVQ